MEVEVTYETDRVIKYLVSLLYGKIEIRLSKSRYFAIHGYLGNGWKHEYPMPKTIYDLARILRRKSGLSLIPGENGIWSEPDFLMVLHSYRKPFGQNTIVRKRRGWKQ